MLSAPGKAHESEGAAEAAMEPLKLEEEEEPEEETEAEGAAAQPAEPTAAAEKNAFELHGHLVEEAPAEPVNLLVCKRCGAIAPITEATAFEAPCKTTMPESSSVGHQQTCQTCGRPAKTLTPTFSVFTGKLEPTWQCENCQKDFLRTCRKGPEIRPGLRGHAPGYYLEALNTWFQELGGAWPCPACEEFFDTIMEVAQHFVEKHGDKARPLEAVEIGGIKAFKSWQGVYCPACGFLCDNERHLLYHHRREHT